LVAGGIREALGALLGVSLTTHLYEPAVPRPEAWNAIGGDALLYRLRGSLSDAAIVLRVADASAMAAAAFGERPAAAEPARALSPLERDVVDRAVAAIARTLAPVCGACEREPIERIASVSSYRTYFEIAVDPPVGARIGIALSIDAPPAPSGNVTVDGLARVELLVDALVDVARVPMHALVTLRCGDVVAVEAPCRTRLSVAGRAVGEGAIGVRGGRYAVSLRTCA
jgi:hypothetical protein